MVLLKLMLDLRRLHHWKMHIWHGDHGWHSQSETIAKELKDWCAKEKLDFFCNRANQEETRDEAKARAWRYKCLLSMALLISKKNQSLPCEYVLTGHTSSDRAETLLLNLARGSGFAGISSLPEARDLDETVKLIRPLLIFSRNETAEICQQLKLPIWLDPSNKNLNFSRNKVRQKIIPVLEELHPGCSTRIASLSERFAQHKNDQQAMATLVIETFKDSEGLCRVSLSKLPLTARATVLTVWLKQHGVPVISTKQLEEICQKIEKKNPPGCCHLANKWKILWVRKSIQLVKLS